MRLSVLQVAFPFAPVGPDAVGGAEQVLRAIDTALVASGHRARVLACEGSEVAGELLALPAPPAQIDDVVRAERWQLMRDAIASALAAEPADVVHLHGLDFAHYLPGPEQPALVTLHLPATFHEPAALQSPPAHVWLQPVSVRQAREFPGAMHLLPAIANGVPTGLVAPVRKRRFALALGRVCPEKGFHIAIEACRKAGVPLLIAGRVFGYEAHQRYFRDEIAPHLGHGVRFIGPVGGARKQRLLAAARCLLVPSLAAETSSLVTMEALAAGTPVIARPAGTLVDLIDPGLTGFLADDAAAMADALGRVGAIDPQRCRQVAHERFSEGRMTAAYLRLYHDLRTWFADRAIATAEGAA